MQAKIHHAEEVAEEACLETCLCGIPILLHQCGVYRDRHSNDMLPDIDEVGLRVLVFRAGRHALVFGAVLRLLWGGDSAAPVGAERGVVDETMQCNVVKPRREKQKVSRHCLPMPQKRQAHP